MKKQTKAKHAKSQSEQTKWVAVNGNGRVLMFDKKPSLSVCAGIWWSSEGETKDIGMCDNKDTVKNWTESLVAIPA